MRNWLWALILGVLTAANQLLPSSRAAVYTNATLNQIAISAQRHPARHSGADLRRNSPLQTVSLAGNKPTEVTAPPSSRENITGAGGSQELEATLPPRLSYQLQRRLYSLPGYGGHFVAARLRASSAASSPRAPPFFL
jgi:hypothetical protein